MLLDRRNLLKAAVALTSVVSLKSAASAGARTAKFGAVAFDAFTVFDPRSVNATAEALFPGRGMELMNVWRTRQFEYAWLRVVTGSYRNFSNVTDDALTFAARSLKLELSPDQRRTLVGSYSNLKPWPDAVEALQSLRAAGLRLALLSNFTPAMLDGCIQASKIPGLFDMALSTDAIQTYKPDPRAYRLAVDQFKLDRENILFAAFGAWDAAGAKAFGFTTFWNNRLGVPYDELTFQPDVVGASLTDLRTYLEA
ncbi:MAG: haloacid dehalogenase type II [Hyphomicrobium sp.]|jgi:2-haloacid dehalogenase